MVKRILLESVWMLLRNFGQALRFSVMPFGVLIAACLLLLLAFGTRTYFVDSGAAFDRGLLLLVLSVVMLPLGALLLAWIAVSWHRMVLKETGPTAAHDVGARSILPYAGQSALIIGLALVVVFAEVFILALTVALTFDLAATDQAVGVLFTVGFVSFTYIWLRWGIALVGTALEKPMSIAEAWRTTRSSRGAILGVSVFIVFINRAVDGLIATIGQIPVSLDVAVTGTVIWITAMLGISSLTTLYGYCVEGRH